MAHPAPDTRTIVQPLLRRTAIELGPALLFFIVFFWKGIAFATGAFMAAAVVSVVVSGLEKRQLPRIPMISAVIVLTLGGLTLVLEEEMFIKIYPTVANGLSAVALGSGQMLGQNILKRAFSSELPISDRAWKRLVWHLVVYLLTLAALNEVVWRSFSTETWVVFKTFIKAPANIVFVLAHVPFVRAHWCADAAPCDPNPTVSGGPPPSPAARRTGLGR